ncbi:TlpA family protein disulfide reductase [Rhodopirellula sp. JC740]|uniref:TlpA family protein disulfide reductase n=1 Tax=Rhodopirellula halodulae TaxID=2894198 RepID=A0ABS8NLZ6_9BACT|nr:TlpA disulfide reductase family protein [Rhodopirellula sp. JC740]MCC9643942.1 TlpA family protein disulfide reductase [Rhodopirellula sp. JC740]
MSKHNRFPASWSVRGFVLGGGSLFLSTLLAGPATAAAPSAAAALGLKPVQDDVEYEQVESGDVEKCEVQDIERDDWSGWEVLAEDGTLLRRFADTNGDKKVDLWCYFQYGVEVYRDVDANFNGKADQYRWMGTGGTRWGIDENEDGQIDRWKMISAEETTRELVHALSTADGNRFVSLLASPKELQSAGLDGERLEGLIKKASRAASNFKKFAANQRAIGRNAEWIQFAAATPGIVPADEAGVKKDVMAYENAVAMYESDGKSGQMLVGTVIRIDDAWKLIDLPVLADSGEPIAQSNGVFFTPGGLSSSLSTGSSAGNSQTQELVSALESVDSKMVSESDPKALAQLNEQRADIVEDLISAAETDAERETWTRQLVDTVSVATQSGTYPGGLKRLKALAASFRDSKSGQTDAMRAYTEYQLIGTEYIARQTEDADFAENQVWWLEQLTEFADRYPRAPETAAAKLQLALSKEFEDKETEALKFYREVATDFRGTEAAERAAGAVRRLESEGKEVDLEGRTVQGKAFRLSALRGRPVVLHYWATWCEPCKNDMKLLRGLQARYQRAGLQIVGVNIDNQRNEAEGFLKTNALPWIHLYEDGGLEGSPLAKQFGVQTLPTTMLIDSKGRLVDHNIGAAELDDAIEKLLK